MLGVKRRSAGRWLSAPVLAVTLNTACSDSTGPVPVASDARVSPLGAVLQVGQSRQYIVRVFDANENELFGRAVSWSTTTPEIVFVGQDGVVRGVAPGYGDVIATVEGRTGISAVTVPTPEPDGQ